MSTDSKIISLADKSGFAQNKKGGLYCHGKGFSKEKWLEISKVYHDFLDENAKQPSVRQLAIKAKISHNSAKKAIEFIEDGSIKLAKKGHGRKGVGSLMDLSPEEEMYLLMLREEAPSRPNISYVYELLNFSGREVSASFISQWFLHCRKDRALHKKPLSFQNTNTQW